MIEQKLKRELCNKLIVGGFVKLYYVIKHNYTDKNINSVCDAILRTDGICSTLDTRCDCIGVVVNK